MDNLNDMLRGSVLTDIEAKFTAQFSGLQMGYYDAKLAVMLYMMMDKGISKFNEICTQDFPSELKDKFQAVKDRYEKEVLTFREHMEENARIIRAIDQADTECPKLEHRIAGLLSEFDALIKAKLDKRDVTPVGQL